MNNKYIFKNLDWVTSFIYLLLVSIGWLSIYATHYNPEKTDFFDFSQFYAKQFIFIIIGFLLILLIFAIEGKFFERFSSIFYTISIFLLLGLFIFGKETNGAKAWYSFGSITIQPAEFAKTTTALVFAKQLSNIQIDIRKNIDLFKILAIIALPCLLILMQPDPGSVLVYGSFIFVLYREGMNPIFMFLLILFAVLFIGTLKLGTTTTILLFSGLAIFYGYITKRKKRYFPIKETIFFILITITTSLSTDFVFNNIFKQHHRDRFSLWLRLEDDIMNNPVIRRTTGYNQYQSEAAIRSGGFSGKGFLEGTRTKGSFVPEQHTDYILTTLGEEWGFIGTASVVLLFTFLLIRIWYLAEKQRNKFNRIYGYCVTSIFFVHFFVNIGMVIGILPTIGIPLPFFSYGGSGFLGFTLLLFIFLKLDANQSVNAS